MRTLFSLSTDSGIDGVGTYLRAGRAKHLGLLSSVLLNAEFLRTKLGSGPRALSEAGTETLEIDRSRQDTVSASIPVLPAPQGVDRRWPRESFACMGVGLHWDACVIDPFELQERVK